MLATSSVLIVAGSETSITMLSCTMNHLVQNPDKMALLAAKIRKAFKREDDFALSPLRDLPYLNVVLNEGLRMCNSTPVGAPRVVPPGCGTVSGVRFPEGEFINMHSLTVSRSPKIWYDSNPFHPKRWLEKKSAEFGMDQQNAIQLSGVDLRSCIGRLLTWAEIRLILARLV
ncbi:cytochrome P450 [Karstenula rhodostoma CBS 690.94]|uniref:Cytochrome P450 n=1 Tax=Karstenula rhodostoma CBS 690.94 TaxID=1392251 RepID=A0A9P4P5A6_9PLEO|nr:cytochrome P450 [Karstenula rhodostoma CBS 690.94]